jgi:cobalt/nickel transport system permease protein
MDAPSIVASYPLVHVVNPSPCHPSTSLVIKYHLRPSHGVGAGVTVRVGTGVGAGIITSVGAGVSTGVSMGAGVSIGAGVLVAGAVAVSLKKTKGSLDSQMAPMAGLVAVFIFAAQMINFPVAAGTSGHLMGGALSAILVGPWVAVLVMTVVVGIQALVFADGGLSALGLNILNMGIVTVVVGTLVFAGLMKILSKTKASIVAASAIAAFVSVAASAFSFVIEYYLGGNATYNPVTVLISVVGVHLLIGIGEAIITALTVSAILATRADLVEGARKFLPGQKLIIRDSSVV